MPDNSSIDLDLSPILQAFAVLSSDKAQRFITSVVAVEAQSVWKQAVSGAIVPGMANPVFSKGYAEAVSSGLEFDWLGNGHVKLSVERSYPHAAEIQTGTQAFDMKPGLLRSGKAKHGKKGGTYVDVPFRAATSKPYGDKSDQGIAGRQRRAGYASTMPRKVYDAVRELANTSGERYEDPSTPIVKPAVGGMSNPYQHKSAFYAGLHRRKDTATGRNRYMTFRRVSSNSESDSWWHPATPPNDVIGSVMRETQDRLPQLLQGAIGKILMDPDVLT